MIWLLWVMAAIVLTASERCLHRALLKNKNIYWEYMIGYNFGATILFLTLISNINIKFNWSAIILLICAGVFWFMSCLYNLKAYQSTQVSLTSLISHMQILLVVFGGVLLFNEHLNKYQLVGVGCMIIGLSILFWGPSKKFEITKGLMFKFISVITMAAALLIDKRVLLCYPPLIVAISGYMFPLVLTCGLRPTVVKRGFKTCKNLKCLNLFLGILSGLSYLCLMKAFSMQQISIVYPIYQFTTVLVLIFGIFVLNERERIRAKIMSSMFMVTGAVLLCI